jgi:hypothetical protein
VRVSPAALRFPSQRVLLARTKLAYVHLRNLLTDAKRDRSARVFGYVVVWLPEELLLLYLQEGEVVAATTSADGVTFSDIPIRHALSLVPNAAEYGEICFHTAEDEQLACMHAAQTMPPEPFAKDVRPDKGNALLGHLLASTFDGMLEINAKGALNYVVFRHGVPRRGFFADEVAAVRRETDHGDRSIEAVVNGLWPAGGPVPSVRQWGVPPVLPNQAAPPLIDAYRTLVQGLAKSLDKAGVRNAVQLVERARQVHVAEHPALENLELGSASQRDPVTTGPDLACAVGAWVNDVLLAVALPEGTSPEKLLRELTRERRHLFQSAGFFDELKWKLA